MNGGQDDEALELVKLLIALEVLPPDAAETLAKRPVSQIITAAATQTLPGPANLHACVTPTGAPDDQCRPGAPESWTIDASTLNILWGDLLPRIVARTWAKPSVSEYTAPPDDITVVPTLSGGVGAYHDRIHRYLAHQIDWFLDSSAQDPSPRGSRLFQERMVRLRSYLTSTETQGKRIPVRFLPGSGYDFILSDQGLDFALPCDAFPGTPPDPAQLSAIYHHFVFRSTGTSPIAVPMGHSSPPDTPPVPTVQIATSGIPTLANLSPDIIQQVYNPSTSAPDLSKCCESPNRDSPCVDYLCRILEGGIPLDAFTALVAAYRCWWLTGSAYRRIMQELPRVIATIWHDGLGSSYDARYGDPGDAGLRTLFEERVEIVLHPASHMRFRESPTELVETIISDRGFEFPKRDAPPTRAQLITAWIDGTAGNPVFTDSAMTA